MVSAFSACTLSALQKEPTAAEMNAFFLDHREDFEGIVRFLLSEEHRFVLIEDSSGTMLAGTDDSPLSEVKTTDGHVLDRLQLLFQKGCQRITKDAANNCVAFQFWGQTIGGVSGGVVYAVSSKAEPHVEFLTELSPLSAAGWYYYVSDYEQWRVDGQKAQDV